MADGEIKVVFRADSSELDSIFAKIRTMSGQGGPSSPSGPSAPPVIKPPVIPTSPLATATGMANAMRSIGNVASMSGIPFANTIASIGARLITMTAKFPAAAPAISALTAAAIAAAAGLWRLFKSADEMTKLAVKSFFSNRPLGIATQMAAIGAATGAKDDEALALAIAVKGLNEQFAKSASIMTRVSGVLVDMHIKFSAAMYALKALTTQVFSVLAPSISKIANSFRLMWEAMQDSYVFKAFAEVLSAAIESIARTISYVNLLTTGFLLLANAIGDFVAYVIDRAAALMTFGASDKMGITGNAKITSDQTRRMADSFTKQIENLFTGGGSLRIPQIGGPNRMAPSSWERMGLVVGFGSSDPARQTAQNTRQTAQQTARTNQLMTQLISILSGQRQAHNAP